jgi:phosphatidate cytidylyltransferase
VVLSVLAQVGDLAASSMKRWFGIKDFGRIMGPHGGAMDRLDSVLFLTPAVFAFYTIMLA